jgi:hypothetical protein
MTKPDQPKARPEQNTAPERTGGSFRQRFDALERQRVALIARLESIGGNASAHPSYKRAKVLLNATFRKASLAQRLAVLQAAAWLIDLLENITFLPTGIS